MTQHLHDMAISKVSLVDRGANGKRFAVLKREDEVPPEDGEPIEDTRNPVLKALATVAEALGVAAPNAPTVVEKDEPDVTVEWPYGDDADKALDEFRAFTAETREVAKAGRKISGARLTRMKEAMRILGEIVEGVEEGYWHPPEAVSKEQDMDDKELMAAVEKAADEAVGKTIGSEAFTEALDKAVADAVAKATPEPAPEPATEPDPTTPEGEDEINLAQVAEAVAKLAERMDAKDKGERTSLDGQDDGVAKSDNPLAGIL